jgi:uncharacterized membrane protein YtjA (UPF0391 family)
MSLRGAGDDFALQRLLPDGRRVRAVPLRARRVFPRIAAAGAAPRRRTNTIKERTMLYWAAVFFVIALIAALFGFGGLAAGAVEIAKILFFVFLIVFVVTLILGLFRRGPP